MLKRKYLPDVAFYGGQLIGSIGIVIGCVLLYTYENFLYFVISAFSGLTLALLFVDLVFNYIKKHGNN